MRKIIFFGICLIVFLIGLGYLFKFSNKQQTDNSVLIVGTASGYAPFVSLNQQNEYEGFDIDFARALAAQMGKRLELRDLGSMSSLFLALQENKIDAIIWGLSIIPERLQKVAMIPYQGDKITAYKMVFWKTIPDCVKSIDDLVEKTICVEMGSAQERVLSRYKAINQKPMEKVTDALMELQYAKADAAFIEPAVAKKFQEKFSEIKMLDIPLDEKDQELGTGVAIKKDRKELINQVSKAIETLKKNGMLDALELKWGMNNV